MSDVETKAWGWWSREMVFACLKLIIAGSVIQLISQILFRKWSLVARIPEKDYMMFLFTPVMYVLKSFDESAMIYYNYSSFPVILTFFFLIFAKSIIFSINIFILIAFFGAFYLIFHDIYFYSLVSSVSAALFAISVHFVQRETENVGKK